MGKKKVKPNAFTEFMHDFIKKERILGRNHPKEQWSKVATPHWERLSVAEKDRYKLLAKTKPTRTVIVPAKYTSQGVPLEQIEREEQEFVEKKRYMERTVKNMVDNAMLNNDLAEKPFSFIMANYFYKTPRGHYSPAEIAVASFTFKDGIYEIYHTFVNPGKPYHIKAISFHIKDRSERIHRLPYYPNALGEKNLQVIYSSILGALNASPSDRFDKNDERRRCVFIRKEDIEMIESILDTVSDRQWTNIFDVFELELLFNMMTEKVKFEKHPISITNMLIEQDRYDTLAGIYCDLHEQEDVTRHCSLSYVRRWFYLFADNFCTQLGVELKAGKHVPQNADLGPPSKFDDWDSENETKVDEDNHNDDLSVGSTRTGYSKFVEESSDSDD